VFTDDVAKLVSQLGADVSKTSALEINQASSIAQIGLDCDGTDHRLAQNVLFAELLCLETLQAIEKTVVNV
jgi:hypothetical protein